MTIKTFSQLRKNSSKNFEKLQKQIQESEKKDYSDDRFWNCQLDKAGTGQAIIRFLPESAGDELPYAKVYSYGFKGPGGKWFIENCPSTIGKDSPVLEMNNELWAQGEGSEGQRRVRGTGKDNPGTKRKLNYYANIYVVEDKANPENNGKVFLFKFGPMIFDKIEKAMFPEFPDDPAIKVFDLYEGANFKLRIGRKDGYANYDSSVFEPPGPLLNDDAKLEEIWNSQHSLSEFTSDSAFKSYDELKKKLDFVLGASAISTSKTIEEDLEQSAKVMKESANNNKIEEEVEDDDLDKLLESLDSDDEDDDDLSSLIDIEEEDDAPF